MIDANQFLTSIAGILLGLAPISGAPTATLEIHEVYSPTFSRTVTDDLPWSVSLRKGAEARIQAQVAVLEDALRALREQGATRLVTRPIKDTTNVNERLARNGVTRIKLLGYSGKELVNPGGTEYQEFMRYGDYLIRPSTISCSLVAWNLFIPSTWFDDRCTIERPTIEHYLNYSLRAFINYSNPRDLVFYLEGALKEMIKRKLPFSVENGQIKAEFSDVAKDLQAIPLQDLGALGGYKITVNSDKSKIVFTELPPNLKTLASKGKYFAKDQMLAFDVH
ncbi:MAG: hypothetical protein ACKOWI_07120 [Rhodoluna sp.]